jgi:diguanylate cyclase (GGDEF)-like protein
MTWQSTPFFAPLMLSASICVALALVAYAHRRVRAARSFALLMGASAWWSFFYALYLASTALGERLLWAKTLTAGAAVVALAWLLFALEYGDRADWLGRRRVAALWLVPLLTVAAVATNERHGLFWRSFELSQRPGLAGIESTPGPAFWAHVGVSWLLMSAAVLLLLGTMLRAPHTHRRQAAVVLFGALVPWLGNVVHLLGWARFPANPMPFLFTLSGLAFGWAIFRFRFLGVLPVAWAKVVQDIDDAVLVTDEAGRLLDLNPSARRLLAAARIGTPLAQSVPALVPLFETTGAGPATAALPLGGEDRVYDVRVTQLFDGREPLGHTLVLREVTERIRLEEQLRHNAFYCSLTGLANRALLLDRLEQAVERTRRGQHHFALLFLDLDRFKRVNDSLGHAAGDELLVAFAHRLSGCTRPADTVARLSGDEFAVLIEEVEDLAMVVRVAERIQRAAAEPVVMRGHEIVPAVSIGIALSTHLREISPEALLRDADLAMYRSKRTSATGYTIYDETMYGEAIARLRTETELRRAVERGEFTLHYQPIVAGATGEEAGCEALLRWHHPERGLLPPSEFMAVAAEIGLMPRLGEWVVDEILLDAARWAGGLPGGEPRLLVVNVLAHQLAQQPQFVTRLEAAQRRVLAHGTTLMLDIGETAVLERQEQLAGVMQRLSAQGIGFAVDDFGTGASSLPHLLQLPITALKIDRRFIGALEKDATAREVVSVFVSLARSMRLKVFAEGVESAAQRDHLRSLGCDYMQGYLFGVPAPGCERVAGSG